MLFLLWLIACLLTRLLVLSEADDGTKELEILVLRHQLRVLRRKTGRPKFTAGDRVLLAATSRVLPRQRWASFLVAPQTTPLSLAVGWLRALPVRPGAVPAPDAGRARRRPRRPAGDAGVPSAPGDAGRVAGLGEVGRAGAEGAQCPAAGEGHGGRDRREHDERRGEHDQDQGDAAMEAAGLRVRPRVEGDGQLAAVVGVGALGLDRAGVADRRLGAVPDHAQLVVDLLGPQLLALRALPDVQMVAVGESAGAPALGAPLDVAGGALEEAAGHEQEQRVGPDQQHFGVRGAHPCRSPAAGAGAGSVTSVNRMSSCSSRVTWATRWRTPFQHSHSTGNAPPRMNSRSPGSRSHSKKELVGLVTNLSCRAWKYPWLIDSYSWMMPSGNRVAKTIHARPMLVDQNAIRAARSDQRSSGMR